MLHRSRMADNASEAGVCPGQRKLRLNVMIELPGLPASRVVATVALVTQSAAMRIVTTMTCDTVILGIVKRRGRMTLTAGHVRVRADQRKTGNVMIEPQLSSPIGRDMAILAPCA